MPINEHDELLIPGDPDAPMPVPSWKEQRDKARVLTVGNVLAGLAEIAKQDHDIDRFIAALRDDLDMAFVDIATATGISVSIVRSRYERAKGG